MPGILWGYNYLTGQASIGDEHPPSSILSGQGVVLLKYVHSMMQPQDKLEGVALVTSRGVSLRSDGEFNHVSYHIRIPYPLSSHRINIPHGMRQRLC